MSDLPDYLLKDVLWSCGRARHPSPAAFSAAVRQYHLDIIQKDTWSPDEGVLPLAEVRIGFECWDADGEHEHEPIIQIKSDQPGQFTALGLLFAVCDGIAEHLDQNNRELFDHCFFEGLSRAKTADPPLYWVRFGS